MREKVLFVDDDSHLLDGLRRALRHEPFEFVKAESAQEALAALANEDISVVISDQDMPEMNGTEFLAIVAERHPDTVRFMLTGNATLDVAMTAINDGAITRFFTKPCNNVDLAATIRQALEHRELLRMARQLMGEVKRQKAVIGRLETEHPGISEIERDASGAIVIEEAGSLEDLLKEAEAYFG